MKGVLLLTPLLLLPPPPCRRACPSGAAAATHQLSTSDLVTRYGRQGVLDQSAVEAACTAIMSCHVRGEGGGVGSSSRPSPVCRSPACGQDRVNTTTAHVVCLLCEHPRMCDQ